MQAKKLGVAAEAVAALALIGAPLALGAVHLPVMLAVSALGCLAFMLLVLSLRPASLHVGWLAPLLLAVNAAVLAQLVPLPPGLVELVAPRTAELYRDAGVTGWHPLSLDPAGTAAQAARGIGWLCLFAVLQHRAGESKRARRRILQYVAGAGAAVAVLGFGHWLAGEKQTLLGLYTFAGPKLFLSTLGNANNLSGFLNLGGLVALGLAAQAERTRVRVAWAAAFCVCVAGSILTASRGGAMALLAGLLIVPALGWGSRRRKEQTGRDEGWRGWATVGAATVVASALAWWLYAAFPRLLHELETVLDLDLADEGGKLEAYKIAWDAALAHPWFGIGRGAFESVQALYRSQPFRVTFTHAENEPLQALAELGLPLGCVLVLGIALAWLGLVRRGRLSWGEAGAAAGVFALLFQNLVDFSLQFAPGLALLALFAHHVKRTVRVPFAPAAALAVAAPLLVGFAGVRASPGIAAERDALVARGADPAVSVEEVEASVREAWARRPAWSVPAEVAATRMASARDGARGALPWTNSLLRLDPWSGRAHRLAGDALARLGARGQALGLLRRAASFGAPSIDSVLAYWPDDAEAVRAAVPPDVEASLAAGGPLEKAGKRDLAIELLERIATPDERVLNRLYWLRTAQGDHDAALGLAERMQPLAEKPARALALQARALRNLKRVDEARARYEQALAAEPRSTDALFGLAELETGEKNAQKAIEVLDRIPISAPPGTQTQRHWLRALAFRQDKNLLKARDELRIAIDRAPDNVGYRVVLADVLLDLNQLDAAAEALAPLADQPQADGVRRKLDRLREAEVKRQQDLYEMRLLGKSARE